MIQSDGALRTFTGPDRVLWTGSTANVPDWVTAGFGSYEAIYERQPWPATLIDKISVSHARLPLKTYERNGDGRPVSDGPYARLMRQPCPIMSNFDLWRWTASTLNIHGEAVWLKSRDAGGRPVGVFPWHPSRLMVDVEGAHWMLDIYGKPTTKVDRRDFVPFRMFSPKSTRRGMSPLEPLRSALENEYGAQRAATSMWNNGARPSVWLEHPKILNGDVTKRLAQTWADTHGGVDNWSKAAVLEEGMKAQVLPINYEELAYIDSRKLNRDETCARFDIPPPAVHILDRATFSNVTEQMISMWRDSMGWRINQLEDTLDMELRDGSFGDGEPDFAPDEYAEFLMDEVMRGSFEARQDALKNADYMTIAEKRRIENLPFIPGTDRIFLNSASLPLDSSGQLVQPTEVTTNTDTRTVMGRLGRVTAPSELNAAQLVDGLESATADILVATLAATEAEDMPTLRAEIGAALNGVPV